MELIDFTKDIVLSLRQPYFESLKNFLTGEFLTFTFIPVENISPEILAEKISDYFEKLELKTGKGLDKFIENYVKDLDSIISHRIAKSPQVKKNDPTPVLEPRARKYYEKARKSISNGNLIDYSRIMFCLYAAIIKSGYEEITNFDFSTKSLNPGAIIGSMKRESETIVKVRRSRFDIKNLYCSDTCTFILSTMILHKIISDKIEGDYHHE